MQVQEVEGTQEHLEGSPEAAGVWGGSQGGRVHGLSGLYRDPCAEEGKGDSTRVPE